MPIQPPSACIWQYKHILSMLLERIKMCVIASCISIFNDCYNCHDRRWQSSEEKTCVHLPLSLLEALTILNYMWLNISWDVWPVPLRSPDYWSTSIYLTKKLHTYTPCPHTLSTLMLSLTLSLTCTHIHPHFEIQYR